jgi:hypothetical protein
MGSSGEIVVDGMPFTLHINIKNMVAESDDLDLTYRCQYQYNYYNDISVSTLKSAEFCDNYRNIKLTFAIDPRPYRSGTEEQFILAACIPHFEENDDDSANTRAIKKALVDTNLRLLETQIDYCTFKNKVEKLLNI